ncbi:MAG: amino acid dehydrogenase [Desulfovibrio sp.]|nr:MAG: amino acid dehydrogenase [Desulfovibrio sp.]
MDHDHSRILDIVRNNLDTALKETGPWFLGNMPAYYYRTHSDEEQVRHLHALVSAQGVDQRQTLTLADDKNRRVTYISTSGTTQDLVKALEGHAKATLEAARLYTSQDGKLRLDTFVLAPQERADPNSPEFAQALASIREHGLVFPTSPADSPLEWEDGLSQLLSGANRDYVDKFEPERVARHFALTKKLVDHESVLMTLDELDHDNESRIMLGMSDPPPTGLLLEAVRILARKNLILHRGYADLFQFPDGGRTAILSFYACHNGIPVRSDSELWRELQEELKLIKWHAPHGLEAFADDNGWPLKRVMLLMAAAEFAHQFLIKDNMWAYTSENIVEELLDHREQTEACIAFFEARFDPAFADRDKRAAQAEQTAQAAVECIDNDIARHTLEWFLRFFRHTLRTNYYLDDIHGLGFRLDPAFLDLAEGEERPYGVFFFHGPGTQGFHVRYREMARGGVRVVATRTQEQFEMESNRLYDEVTALARAQQFKNKDIPEGGAKAVLLLGPNADIRLCVKSMADSLLDLVLPGENSHTMDGVIDYLGKEEVIYLGPDENIIPEDITWIVQRSAKRGYKWPSAIMSSKPRAGINHKEYGVTSLGVIVFAHEILRALDIDPHNKPFTVKMTGGPKGDVAGNAVKLFHEKYGDNARILAMSDGHGAAHDPDGLNHEELLRLMREELSISSFSPDKIKHKDGFVVATNTPEGVRIRNSLHNTVKADLFLPAGGRPDTINGANWRDFLDSESKPTARAVVEGANLFLTQEARDRLEELDVLVVHGSSANKTGVIGSSYEILGGLVMSEDEFLAIKDDYVSQVLDILGQRARDEARLMLREYKRCAKCRPLTALSLDLSLEINTLSDALYSCLVAQSPDLARDETLAGLLMSYCPPILVENYGERILTRVPPRHLYALIASFAASRMVYAEGMGWLTRMAEMQDLETVVRAYVGQEKLLAEYMQVLDGSDIAHRDHIARLLGSAGRKLLTNEALGLE